MQLPKRIGAVLSRGTKKGKEVDIMQGCVVNCERTVTGGSWVVFRTTGNSLSFRLPGSNQVPPEVPAEHKVG